MKACKLKIKQSNMLCHRCLLNAAKALSLINSIKEIDINLNTKIINITYKNNQIGREKICDIVNNAIVHGNVEWSL